MSFSWISLVAIIAVCFGTASALAGSRTLLRARSAGGVARATWVMTILVASTWLAYGISIRDLPQILVNCSWLCYAGLLGWFYLRPRGPRLALVGALAPAGALAVFLGAGMIHPDLPGWVGSATAISISLPQMLHTLRHGRGPGVSVANWAFLTLAASCWFVYGLSIQAAPVILTASFQVVFGIILVVVLLRARPAAALPTQRDEAVPAALPASAVA